MGSSGKRTRGPNQQTPWSRKPDDPVSVLRLALDTSDPLQRARIEAMFGSAYSIKRALQRDARDRCRAYRAAPRERAADPAAVRDRLGLSRTALEHAAYAHLDAAPHLRRSVTKALGWQDTLSESNDLCARDGSFVAWLTSTPDDCVAVARRSVGTASCATLNETGLRQTTSDRARLRTDTSRTHATTWTYLRDNS